MKIAILGWGSLVWQPKELNYDKDLGWDEKGPLLPVEFSRISNDGRLTLVIDNNAKRVQTLYAVSQYAKLDEAILDLAVREGCAKDKIGWYDKSEDKFHSNDFSFKDDIKKWIHDTYCNLDKSFKEI